jgi:hypothetical protein
MGAARNSRPAKAVRSTETEVDSQQETRAQVSENSAAAIRSLPGNQSRRFTRVPTHVIGVVEDRRTHPRAALGLPLRLKRVAGQREPIPISLVTKNISSSGVYFMCLRQIEPGTPIELEVGLVERPLGRGRVHMTAHAHVVRMDVAGTPGWYGLAATFDEIGFQRDDVLPPRFQKP